MKNSVKKNLGIHYKIKMALNRDQKDAKLLPTTICWNSLMYQIKIIIKVYQRKLGLQNGSQPSQKQAKLRT